MSSRDIVPVDRMRSHPIDVFEPEGLFRDVSRRMDLIMEEMHRSLAEIERTGFGAAFGVRTEVTEEDGKVVVRAELPGFDEDDIDVTVAEGVLTIRAEQSTSESSKGDQNARSYSVFRHSLLLPRDIDSDKVEATLKNGMLTVTLPFRGKPLPDVKRVPVRRAEGKAALSKRYSAELKKFKESLAELRKEASDLSSEVADGLKARFENLEHLGDRFAKRIAELEDAGEGALSGLRRRLEVAWHEMSEKLAHLGDRIRHKKVE